MFSSYLMKNGPSAKIHYFADSVYSALQWHFLNSYFQCVLPVVSLIVDFDSRVHSNLMMKVLGSQMYQFLSNLVSLA